MSGILRDLYSIRGRSYSDRFTLTEKYTKELKSWRSSISNFLDTDRSQAAPLVPIFQRQSNSLNLAYWHTQILTHRPLLLGNFARSRRTNRSERDAGADETAKAKTDNSIGICVRAAMSIVELIHDIIEAGQLYRAYWVSFPHQVLRTKAHVGYAVYAVLRIRRVGHIIPIRYSAVL